MSRQAWNAVKYSKAFYVRTYRGAGKALILSACVNFFLILVVYYVYFHQPEPDFYATSGVTPPVKLTALAAPNDSDKALLEPDPINDDNVKLIPQ